MKKFLLGLIAVYCSNCMYGQNAPGDKVNHLRGNNGGKYTFTTTGTVDGSIWGGMNGIYTDDSRLGKAAVHAGLLRVGETGTVTVTIIGAQSRYLGGLRNGVPSSDYGAWSGSFQFGSVLKAENAPDNMKSLRGNNGTTYTYVLTGTNDGGVWGGADGMYTDDSKLSTAAVHAGLVRFGESASVKVTIHKGQASYKGNVQNGIKTGDYGSWHGSYSFGNLSSPAITNAPTNMAGFRGNIGEVYSFKIVGANSGNVWGGADGIYTDDSPLATAAVHAGLVRVGQEAVIKVRVVRPMVSYKGNSKNGITTKDFGAWQGSYSFE